MDTAHWLILGAVLFLLALSAFFSGAETALTAASRPHLHQLAKKGNRRARIITGLRARKERMIGAILIGNNLVNIVASVLATSALLSLFGDAGLIYASLGMTALVVVFSEVMPKTYAINHAERMALAVAPTVRVTVGILGPAAMAVDWIVRGVLGIVGIDVSRGGANPLSEEELRGAIDLHAGADQEVATRRGMLRSILDLAEVEVREVMTHRKNVVMIDADQPVERIVEDVLASPYTRLPVWRSEPDNILGTVHAKALLRAVRRHDGEVSDLDIGEIAAKPWFIPESTSLLDQLQAFRNRHEHFALVVDEYGAVMGVVTLEDILEEIVGEISDEHDLPVSGVQAQPDGSYIVDGAVTIRDLNREFGWDLPDDPAATVAGLLLYESRQIPSVGQTFRFHGFRFNVLRRQRNQITSILLQPIADDGPEPV
ncbi:MAG: HlyC/CorC family transporter [Alphaproteobacteria bacterium]